MTATTTDMTPRKIVELFKIIARYSPATYGDGDVEGWFLVAQREGWQFGAAGRAVFDHCTSLPGSAPWIKPGDVSARLREVGSAVMASYVEPRPDDPKILDDGPRYLAWSREQRARHRNAGLAAYAATGELPPPPRPEPLGNGGPNVIAEVLAAAPEGPRQEIAKAVARMHRRAIEAPKGRRS
jgi:hypothetical protein